MDASRQRLPLGYWLKRADALLTTHIDDAQHQHGLDRTSWQALHSISEAGSIQRDKITELLAPFAPKKDMNKVIDALEARGLLAKDSQGACELTAAGLALHEQALSSQKLVRARAVQGISQEDYDLTLATLQRLVANLERGVK